MATTIETDNNNLNPVRNEMPLVVSSDSYETTVAGKAVHTIVFDADDMPPNGSTLIIRQDPTLVGGGAGDIVAQLDFAFGPSYFIDGFHAEDLWVDTDVVPYLKQNYWLNTHFIIERVGPFGADYGVRLTAREEGAEFNVIGYATGYVLASVSNTTGGDGVFAENFGLIFQLFLERVYNSGTFSLVLETFQPVDENNETTFDPASVLRSELTPFIPAVNMTAAVLMDGAFLRFEISFAEKYGAPAEVQSVFTNAIRFALLAGRTEVERVNFPSWENQLGQGTADLRFLTNWPNVESDCPKTLLPTQSEFLALVIPSTSNLTEVVLQVFLTYTDGTTTAHALDTLTNPTAGEMWLFAIGIDARGLDAIDASKTISTIRCYCTKSISGGAATQLTETRYYAVDYGHHENLRQLHYFNSIGGVDTLMLIGDGSTELEAVVNSSSRAISDTSGHIEVRDTETSLVKIENERQAGTPVLHNSERTALIDLLASERIVERVQGSVDVEHWPVQILTEKAVVDEDAIEVGALLIKYRYAFRDRAHGSNAQSSSSSI